MKLKSIKDWHVYTITAFIMLCVCLAGALAFAIAYLIVLATPPTWVIALIVSIPFALIMGMMCYLFADDIKND